MGENCSNKSRWVSPWRKKMLCQNEKEKWTQPPCLKFKCTTFFNYSMYFYYIDYYANIIASLTGDRRVVSYVVKCLPARGIFPFHSQPEKAAGHSNFFQWTGDFFHKTDEKKIIFSDAKATHISESYLPTIHRMQSSFPTQPRPHEHTTPRSSRSMNSILPIQRVWRVVFHATNNECALY